MNPHGLLHPLSDRNPSIIARVRLLTAEEGGRSSSSTVRAGIGGYRPQLWIGLRLEGGANAYHDAVWASMNREQLAPGEEAVIALEALNPAVAGVIGSRVAISFYEGHRRVGEGVVLEVVFPV